MTAASQVRYGSIRYVNNLPVDLGLVEGHVPRPAGLRIQEGSPGQLNQALLSGELDVASVSAVTLFGRDDLVLLPEATIASHGPVGSVLLASRVPFEDLNGRDVAVSDESATGAMLLRILLERDVGVQPRYSTHPSDLEAMLARNDAALIIGDDALAASAAARDDAPDPLDGLHVLDLGEAWRAYSGHPMVYALWVARRAFADARPEALHAMRAALTASREWARCNPETVIRTAATRVPVTQQTIATYYRRLHHTLGAGERAGLERFADEAAALAGGPTTAPLPIPLPEVHS